MLPFLVLKRYQYHIINTVTNITDDTELGGKVKVVSLIWVEVNPLLAKGSNCFSLDPNETF